MRNQLVQSKIAQFQVMLGDQLLRQLASLELEPLEMRRADAVAEGEAGEESVLVEDIVLVVTQAIALQKRVQTGFEGIEELDLIAAVAEFQHKIHALLKAKLIGVHRARHGRYDVFLLMKC